jgi:hypothetical protein
MRVLDEVADAIQAARGAAPHPVLSSFNLEGQFGRPIAPKQWAAIQSSLACSLPPLEFVQGHWLLPGGFETIWDLVAHASRAHPGWEPPAERTVDAWRNAQVFAGVRTVLADAGALDKRQVVREARLKRDLGLE